MMNEHGGDDYHDDDNILQNVSDMACRHICLKMAACGKKVVRMRSFAVSSSFLGENLSNVYEITLQISLI